MTYADSPTHPALLNRWRTSRTMCRYSKLHIARIAAHKTSSHCMLVFDHDIFIINNFRCLHHPDNTSERPLSAHSIPAKAPL